MVCRFRLSDCSLSGQEVTYKRISSSWTFHFLHNGYLISIFLPAKSSRNRVSTRLCISLAFITTMSTSRRTSSAPSGTPPNFCSTQISFWAFKAIETRPALKRCSSWDGSSTGGVEASGKNAKVKQKGLWWIASGTGARSVGECYRG